LITHGSSLYGRCDTRSVFTISGRISVVLSYDFSGVHGCRLQGFV